MNYNEYFGKGNQNAGWGTSGTPETVSENWDNYFEGQSVHVPIKKIYVDSPQVSSPTVPNQGNSYMDVTPIVTERPSHELMLKELQQREVAHRLAQQQKEYYKTWNQKVRQMEQEFTSSNEGISDGGIMAQAAPGSNETGRLSDYFDIEPGDYESGRPLNSGRPQSKAKKVIFTEKGPVFADDFKKQKTTEDLSQKSTKIATEDVVIPAEPIIEEKPINEEIPSEELAGFTIPDLSDEEPEIITGEDNPVFPEPEDEFDNGENQEEDAIEDTLVEEPVKEIIPEEPIKEIVTGETEVDSIEEENDGTEEPASETIESVDDMLGGIDISDIPDDIPMNIDEEYAREHEQKKAPKKKTTTATTRKKSDKTVKTKKKTSVTKKATSTKKK